MATTAEGDDKTATTGEATSTSLGPPQNHTTPHADVSSASSLTETDAPASCLDSPIESALMVLATTAPPQTTTGTSDVYIHNLATISAHANMPPDQLNQLFNDEKHGGASASASASSSPELTFQQLYAGNVARARSKIAAGAHIVEAGAFAAVAIWEPPAAMLATAAYDYGEMEGRPIFAAFVRHIAEVKERHLGAKVLRETGYWHLSLLARDPRREQRVKGVVRAVLEPYFARARGDGVPVWIEAGNRRARDVYAYLGARVVDMFWLNKAGVRKDGEGEGEGESESFPTWIMAYNLPGQAGRSDLSC